jgi:curved DNA-binding protein CbpA
MSNYYEILELESTATQAEIKTAIDEKYAYWNSLASHHDPEMVEKASREKRQLEEIRAVLGSKAKRKKYDTGTDENIGGLAEQTRSKNAVVLMPTTSKPITQPRSTERLDAWVCPKCNQVNTIGQKFCCKCGGQIGEECPQCKHLSQIANAFCPRCGTNKVQVATERKQKDALARVKILQDSIQAKRAEISIIERLSRKIPIRYDTRWLGYDKNNTDLHKKLWGNQGCLLIAMLSVIGLVLAILLVRFPEMYATPSSLFYLVLIGSAVSVVVILGVAYLARITQRPKVIKKANEMIQEHTNAIAQMVQEIRQLQMQS